MNLGALRTSLPLLRKELTEQAVRKRTYVLRVLYALVLFLAFMAVLDATVASISSRDLRGALGVGRDLFEFIVRIQALGIFLVLPAMVAGVITNEKERGSLPLIFLTDLGPWEILLEKLLSRLIPMVSFLFLSFPLLAVTYAFGGVTAEGLWKAILLLLLLAFEVGAISLWCSAYFRTTLQAFIAAYLIAVVVQLLPLSAGRWLLSGDVGNPSRFTFLSCITFAFFALLLSRRDIVSRASLRPRGGLLRFFRRLDEYFEELNQDLGNLYLIRPRRSLPDNDPITWRELTTKALGQPHYQIRVVLAVLIPVVFYLMICVAQERTRALDLAPRFAGTAWLLWGLSILFIGILGAGAIVSERASQSLDVLLTTPLSSREIIRQKWRFLRRYAWLLWIPLMTVFTIKAWTYLRVRPHAADATRTLFACAASGVLAILYLRVAAWLSLWIGLRYHRRLPAIFVTLAFFFLWLFFPALLFWVLPFGPGGPQVSNPLGYQAPAAMIFGIEAYPFRPLVPWFPAHVAVSVGIHGLLLRALQRICYARADAYLGRPRAITGSPPSDPPGDRAREGAAADQPA